MLAGHKLKGSWVLVRMKNDRTGGKRENWLLIKHRDEFAIEGDLDFLEDTAFSIASGRTMEDIAAGKGADPSIILYTSGTTGASKGVVLSAQGCINAASDTVAFDKLGQNVLAHGIKGPRVAKE